MMTVDLEKLFWIVDRPRNAQEVAMDHRVADYLEVAEQDFIRGWTDCEEGVRCREYQQDAYYRGYHECYEYEARGNASSLAGQEVVSYEDLAKGK